MPNRKKEQNHKGGNLHSESSWSVTNFLRGQDMFGSPVPGFNINGKAKVTTWFGGIITVMILTVALGYAVTKTYDLIRRANPVITQNIIADYYDKDFKVDLQNSQQIFAFSAVGTDGQPKVDPRYVRMIARYDIKDEEGEWEFENYPLHICTEDDWAKFYEIEK